MFHDRVAYGGTLLAIGAGDLWLSAFPMRTRAAWAWWALLFSGTIGFLAFLTYLGQGYLDTWHGVATLFLLPVFVAGLWRSRPGSYSIRAVWIESDNGHGLSARWGRILLGACVAGLILAGMTIAVFGMTTVFVPSDLRFIGLDAGTLSRISPSLIPVISHDRAGFGGGLCSIGCLPLFMARCAELNRSLVVIGAVMGCAVLPELSESISLWATWTSFICSRPSPASLSSSWQKDCFGPGGERMPGPRSNSAVRISNRLAYSGSTFHVPCGPVKGGFFLMRKSHLRVVVSGHSNCGTALS
jgi:hypothetical protein